MLPAAPSPEVSAPQAHLMTHLGTTPHLPTASGAADYVSIHLVLQPEDVSSGQAGRQQRLARDLMFFVDSARPAALAHVPGHGVSLFLPRERVEAAVGDLRRVPAALPGRSGIGAVLRSHMHMIATQAEHMTQAQRVVVISACVEMALTVLQTAREGRDEAEQFTGGFYLAARRMIERDCGDPQLDPAAVAAALGCSRATLYRLFARQGASVASLIWTSRLDRARGMISSPRCAALSLSEIAFQCGFMEQASFNRMFKRHFSLTPGEVRARNRPAGETA